jgi:hypothetical protein
MSESFHVKLSFSAFIVLGNKIFKLPHPIFTFFWLSHLWRGPGPLFEQTWVPFTQGWYMYVWLILACWFWRRFLKHFSVFLLFRYYLPLGKGNPLHMNKFESTSPKDDLCWVWLKLALWFWRRFLKDHTLFLHFCDYFPFEEDLAIYLNNFLYPRIICTKFDWIWPAGSGEDF